MSALEVADVPPVVVTVTSTAPVVWAGDVTMMDVELCTTRLVVAGVVPNLTVDAAVKFVPVIVTCVVPATDPEEGLMAVTVGVGVP
jgi:hypothetical protein